MNNKLVPGIIMAAIAIILAGSLLVPIIQDYDDNAKVIKNNTTTNLAAVVGEDHEIVFDYDTGALTIDDADKTPTAQLGVIVSDQMNIIYNTTPNLQLFSSQHPTGVVSITSDATITIEDKKITITYATDTVEEYTCEWIYLYDANGDYGIYRLYNQSKTVYLNDLNQMHGSNILTTTSDWFAFTGKDVTLASSTETVTADVTTGEVTGTKDILSISIGGNGTGYSFDVDNSGTDYTVHPWIYVVPNEVTGYSEVDNTIVPLMHALPILVIVAILVGTLAIFIRAKE